VLLTIDKTAFVRLLSNFQVRVYDSHFGLKLCRCTGRHKNTLTGEPLFSLDQEEENMIAENCLTGYDQIIKTKAQSVVSSGSKKSARTETTQSSVASSQASSQHTAGSTKIMRKYVHHPRLHAAWGCPDVLMALFVCVGLTRVRLGV
jgi:hypothetical protein